MRKAIGYGALLGLTVLMALAQTLPRLNPAHHGSSSVQGQALPGSGPITVYDVSFTPRTRVGQSNSMDRDGYFAVPVKPPLTRGRRLVAVDKAGHTSAQITVGDPPSPAGQD